MSAVCYWVGALFLSEILTDDRSAKTMFSTETKQGMQLTVTWLGLTLAANHKACIKYNVFTLRGKSTPEPDLPQTTQAR